MNVPDALETGKAEINWTQHKLTPRERAVLTLLAEGLVAEAIARRLNISTRTVSKHLEHVYRKLGTSDRLTTVLAAQSLGLLDSR